MKAHTDIYVYMCEGTCTEGVMTSFSKSVSYVRLI